MNGKRILIVEDSDLLHRIYELILRRFTSQGGELVYAPNARTAIDMILTRPMMDLIIMDTTLPDMGGMELLHCIKRTSASAEVPVVIISSEGQEHHIKRGLEGGAHSYITKPFHGPELIQLITRIFNSR